jgi:hypothetical protein
VDRVYRSVARILERRGWGLRTDADEDTLRRDEPLLAELYGASVLGSITTGPRTGWRAARAGDAVVDADALPSGRCCASVAGFSVHAGVCIRAHDRMQQGPGHPLFWTEAQLVPKLRSLIDGCPGFLSLADMGTKSLDQANTFFLSIGNLLSGSSNVRIQKLFEQLTDFMKVDRKSVV